MPTVSDGAWPDELIVRSLTVPTLSRSSSGVTRVRGARFAGAVLDHYRKTAGARTLRTVVQAWNERSLRLMRSLGFTEAGHHVCEQDGKQVVYKVLISG